LKRSISTLESSINILEDRSAFWEKLPLWFTAAVVMGVLMELVVIWVDHRDDLEAWALTFFGVHRIPTKPSRFKFWVEVVSIVLVAGGIVGELVVGVKITFINGELRSKSATLRSDSDQLLAVVTQEAGSAASSAAIAGDAASSAIDDLRVLQSLVSGRQVFDAAPLTKLRLNGKLVYVMSGDSEEAKSFCKSVSADLHDIAGINTKPSCQSAYAESETIVRGPSLPESKALAKALTEATHFPFKVIPPDRSIPDLDLRVFIGVQPSFVIKQKPTKQSNSRP
jgi:hypothetical protein